ncbi:hypothetical protein LCL97_05350 [Seohaeicola saemankumensis]|nr:hypothetical protein [Seohaeicola saemankumensis]MCA0870237.1 hypothetical protein [Seohaeicola saemankumensis]
MTQRFFWLLGLCTGLCTGLSAPMAQATPSTNCTDRFADLTKVAAFADSGPARLQLLQCLLNEQHQLKHNQAFDLAWDEEGFLGLRMNFPLSLFAWRQKLPPPDSDDKDTTPAPLALSYSAVTDTGQSNGTTSGGSHGGGKTGTPGVKYACTCGGIDYISQPKTGVPDFTKYELDSPQLYVRIPVDQLDSLSSIDTERLVQAQTNVAQSYGDLAREPYDTGYLRYLMTGAASQPASVAATNGISPLIAAATAGMSGASATSWDTDPCGCPEPDYQPVTGVPANTKYEIENALRGLDHIAVEAWVPGDRLGFDGTLRLMIKE